MSDLTNHSLSNRLQCVEDYVRRDPVKALASAAGAGFLLNVLPVGSLAAGLARLACVSVRPALFVLGAMKAYEMCQTHKKPYLP